MKQNNVILLVGGVGSGKSTVAKYLEDVATVLDCDQLAREVATLPQVICDVKSSFGGRFVVNGVIDRKIFAQYVFCSEQRTQKLNDIFHPLIYKMLERQLAALKGCVVVQCPLFSQWLLDIADCIWLIDTDVDKRKSRVILRDNLTDSEVANRMSRQNDVAKWRAVANEIIYNDGELSQLLVKTQVLIDKYKLHK